MEKTTISLECAPEAADALSHELSSSLNEEVSRAEKQNLGGGLETTLLIIQTAVPIVAALIPVLSDYLRSNKISRIKIRKPDGTEVEIQNPTKEQIEEHLGD